MRAIKVREINRAVRAAWDALYYVDRRSLKSAQRRARKAVSRRQSWQLKQHPKYNVAIMPVRSV